MSLRSEFRIPNSDFWILSQFSFVKPTAARSTSFPPRSVLCFRVPSRSNPSLPTSPSSAWLSWKHFVSIFSTPSANSCSNTNRSASAVVSCPQNDFLKIQCASAKTGFNRSDVTTPPISPSRITSQLRMPAHSLVSQ